jgi:hypothetical protein
VGQRAEHRRCVRAAAAEPRRDRNALLDHEVEAVHHAEAAAERLGGAGGQVGGSVELGPVRDVAHDRPSATANEVHPDLVCEVEGHHERLEIMIAVGAQRTDAEHEVHLGRRAGAQ